MAKVLPNRITPDIVGKYIGISAQAVREGMERGTLPIGRVEKTKQGQKQYIILPKPLFEATGLRLNGYEPPPTVNIDYEKLAEAVVNEFMETLRGR